jgi:hypothetical protein
LRAALRELCPVGERAVSYVIAEFVNSLSHWLSVGCRFSFWVRLTIVRHFDDIVVSFSSHDFTKKSDRWEVVISYEFLKTLLKAVGFLFTKSNSCPLENLSVRKEVLNVTDGYWLVSGYKFFIIFGFGSRIETLNLIDLIS